MYDRIRSLSKAVSLLDDGQIIKTKHGHFAKARNGLVYVAPSMNSLTTHPSAMTWDSFREYYWTYGNIERAKEGLSGRD